MQKSVFPWLGVNFMHDHDFGKQNLFDSHILPHTYLLGCNLDKQNLFFYALDRCTTILSTHSLDLESLGLLLKGACLAIIMHIADF